MNANWDKSNISLQHEGQPIDHGITLSPKTFRPKLLSKVPSMRGINAYNSIKTENFHTYDNFSYSQDDEENDLHDKCQFNATRERSYDQAIGLTHDFIHPSQYFVGDLNNKTVIYRNNDFECPTLSSIITSGDNQSENESTRHYEGSTAKLVSTSKTSTTCWSWCAHAETVLCTISLATGMGNLYRLPQTALIRGGLPFLIAYIILYFLIGLPLLFLELGLGQLSQEGFTKIWRAVPLFRGVGYIKILAICLVSIYYPIYISLFSLYLIWLSKGPPPFKECSSVKITKFGYRAQGIPGQECLLKTFLESPFVELKWYGLIVGILFLVWLVIALILIGRTKAYVKASIILLLPCIGCLIALVVKLTELEGQNRGLQFFFNSADWSLLSNAEVWYYAIIQLFFSTNIGFGSFVTNAGIIFSKVNAFWIAIGYILLNIIFGTISVLLCFMLFGAIEDISTVKGDIAELHLISLIYDVGRQYSNEQSQIWTSIAYFLILFSGFISMLTFVYILLKAIKIEIKQWIWWQTTIIICFVGFILSSVTLLVKDFALIHLLDHYTVGNIILTSVVFEILAIVAFYGTKRIQLDFEFLLGNALSKIWIILWWLIPAILVAVFIWAISTLSLTGIFVRDPIWEYGVGWSIVVMSLFFITIMACFQIQKQDKYYTFNDKIVAVTKPSRKWGPVDPIMRYSWVQWHSKAKNGERDFTLKRRGTRDYTHSIKKCKEPLGKSYTSTNSISSTISHDYNSGDLNQNNIENQIPNYDQPLHIHINSPYISEISHTNSDRTTQTLQISSLINQQSPSNNLNNSYSTKKRNTYPSLNPNMNVHSISINYSDIQSESISEGYGTFRKGPYKMPDDKGQHVCYRRYSDNEISTVL